MVIHQIGTETKTLVNQYAQDCIYICGPIKLIG